MIFNGSFRLESNSGELEIFYRLSATLKFEQRRERQFTEPTAPNALTVLGIVAAAAQTPSTVVAAAELTLLTILMLSKQRRN
jgi:hypothetical protein